jgi:MYXO-CTERM domain-containing protein
MNRCLLLVGALGCCGTAHAGVVNLGGGWQASWDGALDSFVDVQSYGVVGDSVVIQKSAEFTSFPQNIEITFTQIDANAVSFIAIDDEIITNSTGVDWTDFHMEVVGDAAFDPAMTLASGGGGPIGWTISPFTAATFGAGDTLLDIENGVVPSGTQWFPGDGATDGVLFIDGRPSAGLNSFVLIERPTPTPGGAALLGLAGLMVSRRRR